MIPNLVLAILSALVSIIAIGNSFLASRYARQAEAAADRAEAALREIKRLREPSDGIPFTEAVKAYLGRPYNYSGPTDEEAP